MRDRGTSEVVFTVGHSTHTQERFTELLRQHRITAVADVRSTPYSRHHPQFNRRELAGWLAEADIAYVFLGRELGGRSDDPSDYENGRVCYDRLQAKPAFGLGVERIVRGAMHQRIALVCSEKEPLDCHRSLLVARALADRGVSVNHILADGSLETHSQTMKRLLDMTGLKQPRLFPPAGDQAERFGDPISQAVALRAAQVAYSLNIHSANTTRPTK